MTPTEQDSYLREKLNSLFESVFSQGVRAGKDVATETYEDFDAWHKKGELDEAMQLITSLYKELVAEAKPPYSPVIANPDTTEEAIAKSIARYGNKQIDQFEQNLLKALEEV